MNNRMITYFTISDSKKLTYGCLIAWMFKKVLEEGSKRMVHVDMMEDTKELTKVYSRGLSA